MALDIKGLTPLLQVYDMPTSVRFYRDMLGFEVVSNSPVLGVDRFHWVMLRLGGAELMLNTAYETDEERPPGGDKARIAAHGDTVIYLGCPNMDGAYEELKRKGVAVNRPVVAWYGMKQMPVRDPDGFEVCFQWRAEG